MLKGKGWQLLLCLMAASIVFTGCGRKAPPPPAPLLPIPSIDEDALLPLATERCVSEFDSPVTGGLGEGLGISLINVDYETGNDWAFKYIPPSVLSFEDIGFVLCIIQSRHKDGTYSDRAIGYRIDYNVRMVEWNGRTTIAEGELEGEHSPGAKHYEGDAYGHKPEEELSAWTTEHTIPIPGQFRAEAEIHSLGFSPDGKLLAYVTGERLAILDIERMEDAVEFGVGQKFVAYSPDGRLLASIHVENLIVVWDIESAEPLGSFIHRGKPIHSIAFSPDGRLLASGGGDNLVRLWETSNGRQVLEFDGHTNEVTIVAFSPDGRLIASKANADPLIIWDVETLEETALIDKIGFGVHHIAFSPDGEHIALGGSEASRSIWNFVTGKEMVRLSGFTGYGSRVGSLLFSPDGRILAGISGKVVRLWDTTTWEELPPLVGHRDDITSISFSPDGLLLASGSEDHTLRLWNIIALR